MEKGKLQSVIESVLFVSGEPMKLSRLAKVTDVTEEEIAEAVDGLNADYAAGRGLVIVRIKDTVQLATSPDNASFVDELVKGEIQENLSQAALEVLSIVAYRGPMTRAEIEAIRGVNCSFTLRALLIRGLIDRTESLKDNRRYLYSISMDFLKKLGLDSVEKLPDWEALQKKETAEPEQPETGEGETKNEIPLADDLQAGTEQAANSPEEPDNQPD